MFVLKRFLFNFDGIINCDLYPTFDLFRTLGLMLDDKGVNIHCMFSFLCEVICKEDILEVIFSIWKFSNFSFEVVFVFGQSCRLF
jgi:hypothetical protein